MFFFLFYFLLTKAEIYIFCFSEILRQKSEESDTWYKTVWFLVVIAVLLILAVFAVVALCLRRTSGDRTVFVRERDPLPVRPKSRSTAASMSSNYTPSEAHFNLVSTIGCRNLSFNTVSIIYHLNIFRLIITIEEAALRRTLETRNLNRKAAWIGKVMKEMNLILTVKR